jgi:hypothetical protein
VGENDFFIPSMDLASEHGVAPVPYFLQFGTTPTVVRTSSKSQKVHLELLLAQRCGCPKCLNSSITRLNYDKQYEKSSFFLDPTHQNPE